MPLPNRQTGDEKVQQGQRRDEFFKRLRRRAARQHEKPEERTRVRHVGPRTPEGPQES